MTPEEKTAQEAAEAEKGKEKKAPEGGDKSDAAEAAAAERAAIEAAATKKGWRPKGEWTGDPADFVDAKEFLQREPLFTALKESRREVKELKRTVDGMATHMKQTLDATVNARIASLQAQKKEAVKEGDVDKVEAIDKQIDQAKETKTELPKKNEVMPEVEDWIKANPWYKSDAEMHDFALAFNDSYLKRNPGDLPGSLEATTRAVRKAFPEKFPKPADSGNGKDEGEGKAKPAGNVEGSTSPAGKPAKGYDLRRLSSDQKRVYDQMVKTHKVLTHDEYFAGLEKIGELQ